MRIVLGWQRIAAIVFCVVVVSITSFSVYILALREVREPLFAAGHQVSDIVKVILNEPLKFGAVVASEDVTVVKLAPFGDLTSNVELIEPNNRTNIGPWNEQKFAGSSRYEIQQGRFVLELKQIKPGSELLVTMQAGQLLPGIMITNVQLLAGPNLQGVHLVETTNVTDGLLFSVSESMNDCQWSGGSSGCSTQHVTVVLDVVYGGELRINRNFGGEVQAIMQAQVQIDPDVSKIW